MCRTASDDESNLGDDYGMVKAASFDTIYEGRLDNHFEKFDIHAAKDYLLQYAVKLESDRKQKNKHEFISRYSVTDHNGRHFEHL